MNPRRLRFLLALAASAVLFMGCASAPKKSSSQSVALPDRDGVRRDPLPGGKRSPYAPAQEDVSKRGHYTPGGLYAPQIKDSVPEHIPDVDAIPEPVVREEPRSHYGNRSPYVVLGKRYTVLDSPKGYVERGLASYYGNKFHGRRTSNLEVYDMYAFTAAHKSLPLPSFARVTNLDNGKSVVVRVNDRGPFHDDRVIDLSYAAAVKLGYRGVGTAHVEVVGLSPAGTAREPYDALVAQTLYPAAAQASRTVAPIVPSTSFAASAMDALVTALPIASAQAASLGMQAPLSSPQSTLLASARDAAPMLPARADPVAQVQPPASTAAPAAHANAEWRFDMRQDGKAMTPDEFDAWMRARRVRVATGKSETIAPPVQAASGGVAASHTVAGGAVAAPANPPSRATAAPVNALQPSSGNGNVSERVTLQIAAFGNPQNASHALSMLQGAGIAEARVLAGQANGQPIWRLRIGPVDAGRAPELAARVSGLGFGQPQRVRD